MTIQHLPIKSIGKIKIVPVDAIVYIKGASNYLEVHTESCMYLHRAVLQNLADDLEHSDFVRIHRSVLINLTHLEQITSELGRYSIAQMSNGHEVRIGNSYRDQFFKRLGIYATDLAQHA